MMYIICIHRDVMTLPTLKKHIYRALDPSPGDQASSHLVLIEAKLNVLHTTYLALLSELQLDEDLILKGQQVFQTLFSRHFEENQEVNLKLYLTETSCRSHWKVEMYM